ncbi:MAG: RimK/LysX family protein [bacterium]|nr:RimK/LysX family protein [bacterium]
MKLTIISDRPDSWHQNELLKSAKELGFQATINDVLPSDIPDNLDKKLGDVVIWRSSSLDGKSERTALAGYLKDKIVINDSLFKLPAVRYKYFQQNYLKSSKATAEWSIPTYRAKNLDGLEKLIEGESLNFPFIAKPNMGAEGKGVLLVKTKTDLKTIPETQEYVFQNFIANDGDWRIIIVGGTPLGAMKRQAAQGSHLNNISQGATASLETDEIILTQIYKMAAKAASLFHLAFCGVDIIRDQKTGKFYVLEVNTVPAWDEEFGFQAMTGVDVPAKVMEFAKERSTLNSQKPASAIEKYYKNRISISDYHTFHFASRLWLWSGDAWSRKIIDKHEDKFIGKSDESIRLIIESILQKPPSLVNQSSSYRLAPFSRHPKLFAYNQILYRVLFAQTLYGRDIRPIVREFIPDEAFIKVFNSLIKDEDAIRRLSTHAINYIYWLKNYFQGDKKVSASLQIDPSKFITQLSGYKELEAMSAMDHKTSVKSQIYLLAHVIIGRSNFYLLSITDTKYQAICAALESLIKDNYFDIPLDNKLEFLVCAQLCNYPTDLRELINQEAKKSLSWAGNFLVDQNLSMQSTANSLISAEHRNTLYLMTQRQFQQSTKKTKLTKNPEITLKKTIGSFERVSFPDFNLIDIIAKIDTGATTGSLHATGIEELKLPTGEKALRFLPYGKAPAVIVKSYKFKQIRSSNGETSMRYVIPTTIVFGGVQYPIRLTLADRTPMKKGVLVGRRFLRRHGFVVDVKRGTKYRGEVKPL